MGIVLRQSAQNTVVTFIGFAFGAINTLFLYTNILNPKYYGLVLFILATGALIMPLFALGSHNALLRFYTAQPAKEKRGFLGLMLITPLLVLVPAFLLTTCFKSELATLISKRNEIVGEYLWYLFLTGMAMAYFELFYAWSKVHLKSVFGNFMKEVFARVCITILLLLLFYDYISLRFFIKAVVGIYFLRMLAMMAYAFKLQTPQLQRLSKTNIKRIWSYALLMVVGGSVALVLTEIDKVMINQFIALDNVAFYGVAVFIATVIAVPNRAMNQITHPMTASYLNTNNYFELDQLYKKTSLNSFIISGLLFLLIVLNLQDLYQCIPPAYRDGFTIVFLLGLAKVFDAALGNINAILFYSKYYTTVLLLGVLLAITTIMLNLWLIPTLGIDGAALASFSAIVLFNLLKMAFVKQKFGFFPFDRSTVKTVVVLLILAAVFVPFHFKFHPILNIIIKSTLVIVMYGGILYRFHISKDINTVIKKFLGKH